MNETALPSFSGRYQLRSEISLHFDGSDGTPYICQGLRAFRLKSPLNRSQLTDFFDQLAKGCSGELPAERQALLERLVALDWVREVSPSDACLTEGRPEPPWPALYVIGDTERVNAFLAQAHAHPWAVAFSHHPSSLPAIDDRSSFWIALRRAAVEALPGIVISLADASVGPWERELNALIKRSTSLIGLRSGIENREGVIGPWIKRDADICWQCYFHRRERSDRELWSLRNRLEPRPNPCIPGAVSRAFTQSLDALVYLEALEAAKGASDPRLVGKVWRLSETDFSSSVSRCLTAPDCPLDADREFVPMQGIWDDFIFA